uniref:Uncharacterized protein n=1 Tax=Octopus bimaculoides TaxID=37653 RepID=A0A0L8HA07_OCTBM
MQKIEDFWLQASGITTLDPCIRHPWQILSEFDNLRNLLTSSLISMFFGGQPSRT